MTMRKALITGITGQVGSYLAEFLLEKDYIVHGIIRRSSSFNTARINHLYSDKHNSPRLFLHYGDITDSASLHSVLKAVQPDEIYHLACQSHVSVSFKQPIYTSESTAIGTINLLEAVRNTCSLHTKVYNSSSSEMFGLVQATPQSEKTPFYPRSPYACGKAFAHYLSINYREAYGMFVSNGILFNTESPRRGETFVTRKITRAATRIKEGLQEYLYLGNLCAKRDWGFAGDTVEAMWLILQSDTPDDFVIATGQCYTVEYFAAIAFAYLGLKSEQYIKQDKEYFRPTEVDLLIGNNTKIRSRLGWKPKTGFHELIEMMVKSDLDLAKKEKMLL